MAEALRTVLDADQRARAERARRVLRNSRKDSADKWHLLYEKFDPLTGVRQKVWYNVETEEVRGQRIDEYLSKHLDQNQDEYIATMNRTGKVPDMVKVASIPMGVFLDNFQVAHAENDPEHVMKMLNDPDNAKLRTRRGRL